MLERKNTVRHTQAGHQCTGKNSPQDGKIVYKITNHEKIYGQIYSAPRVGDQVSDGRETPYITTN